MKSARLPAAIWAITLLFCAPGLRAQNPVPLVKNAVPSAGQQALPLFAEPAALEGDSLHKFWKSSSKGILLVGHADKGHGTAWVLSRQHRLLVTNAHVADMLYAPPRGELFAIVNGQSQVYEVEKAKVWYHPGLRRESRKLGVSMLSANPGDGDVDANSPDIAVLQLTADGPDLETEFRLATPEELAALNAAQPLGMCGFPGHDTKDWPKAGGKALGTFHSGLVSRITDFRFSANAPPDCQQYIQHTATSWPGFSGSPLFLPNGHVIAVHNSAHPAKHQETNIRIPYGIRIDCLWELLVHCGLSDKVPGIDTSVVKKVWEPDQHDKDLFEAVKLVRIAAALDAAGDFSGAVERCHQAIQLSPDYPWSYRVRGNAYLNYYVAEKYVDEKVRGDRLTRALHDAIKYAGMLRAADPEGLLSIGAVLVNVDDFAKSNPHSIKTAEILASVQGIVKGNDVNRVARMILDPLLLLGDGRITTAQRARAYSFRGTARYNSGERDGNLWKVDHQQAVTLDPTNDMLWENFAAIYDSLGLKKLAQGYRAKADQAREQRKLVKRAGDRET